MKRKASDEFDKMWERHVTMKEYSYLEEGRDKKRERDMRELGAIQQGLGGMNVQPVKRV